LPPFHSTCNRGEGLEGVTNSTYEGVATRPGDAGAEIKTDSQVGVRGPGGTDLGKRMGAWEGPVCW